MRNFDAFLWVISLNTNLLFLKGHTCSLSEWSYHTTRSKPALIRPRISSLMVKCCKQNIIWGIHINFIMTKVGIIKKDIQPDQLLYAPIKCFNIFQLLEFCELKKEEKAFFLQKKYFFLAKVWMHFCETLQYNIIDYEQI